MAIIVIELLCAAIVIGFNILAWTGIIGGTDNSEFMPIRGKRRDLAEDEYALEMGEYGKNSDGLWFCRVPAPGFGTGGLGKHQITEHEDGTITVSPSILCYGHGEKQWHGYLEHGVWRKV